jgi:histidinol-phosphate phosphatase family protein
MSTRPIFWLDRDGTIVDDPGYLDDPGRLVLLAGAAQAVARLNRLGTVVLVTNQSGIGRGFMTRETVDRIHDALEEQLGASGARLDRIEVCPHAPAHGCDCRKPAPGLVLRARAVLGPGGTEYVIGDKPADVELARATGCVAVLVRTGEGAGTDGSLADHVAADLAGAVDWIEAREAAR